MPDGFDGAALSGRAAENPPSIDRNELAVRRRSRLTGRTNREHKRITGNKPGTLVGYRYFPLAFHCPSQAEAQAKFDNMFATLLTLGFAAAALFVLATLGASLARGFAAAAALPRGRTNGEFRMVTVRSASTSMTPFAAPPVMRPVRRPIRQAQAPVRPPQRVAA